MVVKNVFGYIDKCLGFANSQPALPSKFIVALVEKQRMQLIASSSRCSFSSLLTFRGFTTELCLSFKLKKGKFFFQFNLKMKDTIQVNLTRVLVSISRRNTQSIHGGLF